MLFHIRRIEGIWLSGIKNQVENKICQITVRNSELLSRPRPDGEVPAKACLQETDTG